MHDFLHHFISVQKSLVQEGFLGPCAWQEKKNKFNGIVAKRLHAFGKNTRNTRKRRSFASILVHTCHLSLAFPALNPLQPVKSNQAPDM